MSGKRSAQDYAGGVEKRLKAQQAARGETSPSGGTASTRSAPSLDSWEPPVPAQLHQLYGVERGSADEGDSSPHFFPDTREVSARPQPLAPCSATEACCARWQLCETRTRCLSDARLLRTIHDEDGARVCVVATRAYGDEGARQEVVYKRYEMRKEERDSVSTLDVLVAEEIAMLRMLGGRSHCIPLLDSFRDPCSCPVLVMPYIDDFTPSLPSDVRCYMRQLLEALAFLHDDMGVMHRGVKRANILFSRSRQLQLIDFEGSCSVHEGALFARWGNNLYRAPEVAVKPADRFTPAAVYLYSPNDDCLTPGAPVGPPADIWSAGVCFAELLLGVRRLLDVQSLEESYEALRLSLERVRPGGDPRSAFEHQLRRRRRGGLAEARLSRDAAHLAVQMLAWDPAARPEARDALCHPYFTEADDAAEDAAYARVLGREE